MDILQKIIKMDKEAAARAEAAIEKARRQSEESDGEVARESSEIIVNQREKMERSCCEQEQTLNEKLRQAEKVRLERCEKLDKAFELKRSQWKSEIISRVTGG